MNEDTDSGHLQLYTEYPSHGSDRDRAGVGVRVSELACVWARREERGGGGKTAKVRYSQLVGAVARLVHAMSLFEQLKELLNRNARVGGAP